MGISEKKYIEIGKRLKTLRGSTSQKVMATQLDMTLRSYQRYESGERVLPWIVAIEISRKYKVTVDWVLTGEKSVDYPDHEPAKTPIPSDDLEHLFIGMEHVDQKEKDAVIQRYFRRDITSDAAKPPGSISPELYSLIDAVIEVMTSDDEGTKLALSQNVYTFQRTVRSARENAELRRDIEAIKKRLFDEPREADFKTQGTPRESEHPENKHHAGGK